MQKSSKKQTSSGAIPYTKQLVRDFYESFGWKKTPNGRYKDTVAFVDNRKVMQRYYLRAAKRAGIFFQRGGQYFLDAASGANPYTDYSINFHRHICIDFALSGLLEARNKLHNRGLYVAADVTSLPFKDDIFDGILSAHTLYHLPERDQRKALRDLYRVLKPGSPCIILYRCSKEALADRVVRWYLTARTVVATITGLRYLKRLLSHVRHTQADCHTDATSVDQQIPPLYFEPLPSHWFREQIEPIGIKPEIQAYRFISKNFSETFILDNGVGRFFLLIIARFEEWFPRFLARIGSYIITVMIRKKQPRYAEQPACRPEGLYQQ